MGEISPTQEEYERERHLYRGSSWSEPLSWDPALNMTRPLKSLQWIITIVTVLIIQNVHTELEAPLAEATRGEVTLRDSILYINIARPFIAKQETVLRFPVSIRRIVATIHTLRLLKDQLAKYCSSITERITRGIPPPVFHYLDKMAENRQQAERFCLERNMQLAEPQDAKEFYDVVNLLNKVDAPSAFLNVEYDQDRQMNVLAHTRVPVAEAYRDYAGDWYPVVLHPGANQQHPPVVQNTEVVAPRMYSQLKDATFTAHHFKGIQVISNNENWLSLRASMTKEDYEEYEKVTRNNSRINMQSHITAKFVRAMVVCETERYRNKRTTPYGEDLKELLHMMCDIEIERISSFIKLKTQALANLLEAYNIMSIEQEDYSRGLSDLGIDPERDGHAMRHKRTNATDEDINESSLEDNLPSSQAPNFGKLTDIGIDEPYQNNTKSKRALPFLLAGKGLLSVASFIFGEYKDYRFEKKLRAHDAHLKEHSQLLIKHSFELSTQAVRVRKLSLITNQMMSEQAAQGARLNSIERDLNYTMDSVMILGHLRTYAAIGDTIKSQLTQGISVLSQTLQDLANKKIPASIVPLVVNYFNTVQQPMPYALPHPDQSVFLDAVMVNSTFNIYVRIISGNEIYDLYRYFPLPTFGKKHRYVRRVTANNLLVDSHQESFAFLTDRQSRKCERGSCQHVGPFTPVGESTCDVGPLARIEPGEHCAWVREDGIEPYFLPTKYGLLYSVPDQITARLACQVDKFNIPGSEGALILREQGMLEWAEGCDIVIPAPHTKIFGPPVVSSSSYEAERDDFRAINEAPEGDPGFRDVPINVDADIASLSKSRAAAIVGLSVLGTGLLAVVAFLIFKGYVLFQYYKKLKEGSQRIKSSLVSLYATVGDLHKFFSRPMMALKYLQEGVKSYLVRPPKRPDLNEKYFRELPEDRLSTALALTGPSVPTIATSRSESRVKVAETSDDEDSGMASSQTRGIWRKKDKSVRKNRTTVDPPSPMDVIELGTEFIA